MNTRNHSDLRTDHFFFSPVRGRNRAKSFVLVRSDQSCTSIEMNNRKPIRCPFTESTFCAWAAQAAPGDEAEYHRGRLDVDLTPLGAPMERESRAELARVAARARDLAARGFVHLVQRRHGPDDYSYRVIARPLTKAKRLSLLAVLAEEVPQ